MALLLRGSGQNVKLAQPNFGGKRKKDEWRSQYSRLGSETDRLIYLGYRNDVMCRQIVKKWNT